MSVAELSQYRVIRRLGAGGMGEVHLAEDLRLGRHVALKMLRPELIDNKTARSRFEFEARAAAILNHPNITTLYDYDGANGVISLEFVDGETLEDRLAAGPIAPLEAVRLLVHVCRALAHAHGRNVVHRDLKPSNILLGTDGSTKLTDFGLARIRDAAPLTATGQVLGTAAYMCPEQILGQGMDPRGDLFSAGVVLYRTLTGRSPWTGEGVAILYSILHDTPAPLRSIDPTLPAALDALLARLLQKEPHARFSSAEEVEGYLAEVEDQLARRPIGTGGTGPPRGEVTPAAGAVGAPAGAGLSAPGAAGASSSPQPGPASMAFPVPEAPAPRRKILVGRDSEMARLEAALERARLGQGGTVLVSGEAGSGKTRLIEEFRSRAEAAGLLGLAGRCTPQAARNFQPFVEALEEFARRTTTGGRRSEEFSAAHPALATVLPTLELLLDPGRDPALEPRSREQLWHLVDTLLKRLARREPLVLFLDDLHWADEGTLALLHHVALHLAPSHLLIVGAWRPEELPSGGDTEPPLLDLVRRLSAVDGFTTLSLAPLGPDALGALLRAALPDRSFDAAEAAGIHRRASGNPFFALELARLDTPSGEVLPETVADVLRRRLARLPAEEHDLLEMAAVEGDVFHTDVLEAGTGTPRLQLLKRLRTCHQRHQLIEPVEAGHRFRHGLIREVLLAAIPPELKREYHATVAASLRKGYADRADHAGRIGHHLFEGGRYADAVSFLARAGQEARRLFLSERALEFLDQALAAVDASGGGAGERAPLEDARCETLLDAGRPDRARAAAEEVRVRAAGAGDAAREARAVTWLGEAALAQGDHAAADTALAEAFHMATTRGDWAGAARAERRLGELALRRGDHEAAVERFESARRSFQRLGDDAAVASVRLESGVIHARTGHYDRARECFLAAEEQLTAAGDRPGQVRALNWLGSLAFQQGESEPALDLFRRALELARSIGHLQETARLSANIGNVHLVRGELDTAQQAYRESQARFEEIGDQRGAGLSMMALGNVACLRGNFEEAAGHYRRSLAAREALGERWGAANVLDNLGVVEYQLGRWRDAATHLGAALEERTRLGDRAGQAESHLNLGHLEAVLGRTDRALAAYDTAEALAAELGDRSRLLRARLARAGVPLRAGDWEDARAQLDALGDPPEEPDLRATLLLYRGLAVGPAGRDAPVPVLGEALDAARRAGSLPLEAATRLGLAQAQLYAGRRDEALRELEAALSLVAGGRAPLLELRALSLKRALHDVHDPDDAPVVRDLDARREDLLALLDAEIPGGEEASAAFRRAPFPIP